MKNLILIFTLFFSVNLFSQDTLFSNRQYILIKTESGYKLTSVLKSDNILQTTEEITDSLTQFKLNTYYQLVQQYQNYGQAKATAEITRQNSNMLRQLHDSIDTVKYVQKTREAFRPIFSGNWVFVYKGSRSKIEVKDNYRAEISETRSIVLRPFARTYIQLLGVVGQEVIDMYSVNADYFEGEDSKGNVVKLIRRGQR